MSFFFNPRTDAGYWIGTAAERTGQASAQVANTKWLDTDDGLFYQYNGNAWLALSENTAIIVGTQLSQLVGGGDTTAHEHNIPTITSFTGAQHTHAGVGNSGGLVAGAPITAKKVTEQLVNNTATLVNDSVLLRALAANEEVAFTLFLRYDSAAVADFKCAFTSPGGSTITYSVIGPGENDNLSQQVGAASADTLILGGGGAGTTRAAVIHGSVWCGATPGNLQFQFAQNTANVSDTKVLVGSYLSTINIPG